MSCTNSKVLEQLRIRAVFACFTFRAREHAGEQCWVQLLSVGLRIK